MPSHATVRALRKGAIIHIHRQIDTALSSAGDNFYAVIVSIVLIPGGSTVIPSFFGQWRNLKLYASQTAKGVL